MQFRTTGIIIAAVLGASMLNVKPVEASNTIHCTSKNFEYQYCRADTSNYATLERQISRTSCRLGDNWGYDRHGVWVDRGCEGEFKVGHDYYNNKHDYRTYDYEDDKDHDNNKAAVVGAAAVGIALIAALASSKNNNNDEVASWAVGEFSGYDSHEATDVDLRIFPGGSVSGTAGRNKFTGSLSGNELETGNYKFKIKHSGNGFEATDVKDSRHRVTFVRTGQGY